MRYSKRGYYSLFGDRYSKRGYKPNGSATPMRGKSMTCPTASFKKSPAVSDREFGVEDPIRRTSRRQVGDLPRIGVAKP